MYEILFILTVEIKSISHAFSDVICLCLSAEMFKQMFRHGTLFLINLKVVYRVHCKLEAKYSS